MENRNYRIRSLSWLSSLLLLVVLVLLNATFARSGVRLDLTEEGIYTLSDGSRKILQRLEDPVVVKVFWHEVLARFDHTKRYVEALLDEMGQVAGDRFQVSWVDLTEEDGKREAGELGIEQFVFGAAHGSEVRESKGYMSLAIEMGNEKPAVLNALSTIEDQLEYLIVATIYQRSRTTAPIIGMVSAKPPFNPFAGAQPGRFSDFEAHLKKAFGTHARTYLTLDSPIEEDVQVLVVAGPRTLEEKQVYHLEQFLLRGGRAILLLDPVDIENVFGQTAAAGEPHASGLEEWLGHLGVTAEKGVVGDFGSTCLFPMGREAVRYAYWPKVLPAFLDRENPVTRNLAPMPLYWPAALAVDQKKMEAEGRTATILGTTTEEGYRRGDITNLREALETPSGKMLESVPLIVLVEGPTKSFWLGRPIPGTEAAKDSAEGEDGDAGKDADDVGSPDGDGKDAPEDGDGKDAPEDGDGMDAPEDGDGKDAPEDGDGMDAPEDGDEPPAGSADEPADADEEPAADDAAAEPDGPARIEEGSIRLIVVGDAEMICDQLGPRFPLSRAINGVTGFSFVVNAADWLSGSDDLLALRARATNPRNLQQIEEKDRDLLKMINLGLVPLLVLLAGIVVFIVRRS